jgi:hypothetical protein
VNQDFRIAADTLGDIALIAGMRRGSPAKHQQSVGDDIPAWVALPRTTRLGVPGTGY